MAVSSLPMVLAARRQSAVTVAAPGCAAMASRHSAARRPAGAALEAGRCRRRRDQVRAQPAHALVVAEIAEVIDLWALVLAIGAVTTQARQAAEHGPVSRRGRARFENQSLASTLSVFHRPSPASMSPWR